MPLVLFAAAAALVYYLMTENNLAGGTVDKAAFVARLRPIALAVERETGIKADLGIAQAAHESRYGTSGLTAVANNLFGFTAEVGTYWRSQGRPFVDYLTGEHVNGKDVRVTRPFRRYGSWEESYRDWARLIQTKAYAEALPHAVGGNLKAFAVALQKIGYATDPNYAARLEGVARGLA